MELSSLLTDENKINTLKPFHDSVHINQRTTHSNSTRHTMTGVAANDHDGQLRTPPAIYTEKQSELTTTQAVNMSPYGSPTPKSVAFELLFPDSPQFRARLPMRVQIFPHDTTESIVTTVKNFYGLYAGPGGAKGVSFEDDQGNTLIARYENLQNNMVVYVRVIDEISQASGVYGPPSYHSESPLQPQVYYDGDANHMLPPQPAQALSYGQPLSRPASTISRKRSMSPYSARGRRSTSASANAPPPKLSRSRSGYKSRGSSTHGSFADIHSEGMNGYSSGDGAPGSVSSKNRDLGNTEISLDNIVEGGRRKRAKFESSVSDLLTDFSQACYVILIGNRNCLYLPHHRCLLQPRTHRFLPPDGSIIKGHRFLSRILPTTHFPTLRSYNLRRAISMASDSLGCTLHQVPKDDAPGALIYTLL
jgi:hypothetical protein